MVGSCRETCESERLSSAGTTFQALKLRWNCEVDCGQLCGLLSRTEISRSYQVGLHELAFACEVAVKRVYSANSHTSLQPLGGGKLSGQFLFPVSSAVACFVWRRH